MQKIERHRREQVSNTVRSTSHKARNTPAKSTSWEIKHVTMITQYLHGSRITQLFSTGTTLCHLANPEY